MRGRHRLLQLPLLLAIFAAVQLNSADSCRGQEPTVAPGDRIRVKPLIRPKDRVAGSFITVVEDTLRFDVGGDMRQLALSDIKTLEISAGQGSHTKGTIFGGLAGAFGGTLVGAAIGDDGDYGSLAGGFIGFWVGGAIGAALGWVLLTPEKWVAVPVADLRLSLGTGLIYFQFGL